MEPGEYKLTEEQMSELAECFGEHSIYGFEDQVLFIDGHITPEQIMKAAEYIRKIQDK